MWFEILPSAGIILACMSIPHFVSYGVNKICVGNFYRRALTSNEARINYLRDYTITKNPYKQAFLENIPK